MSVSCESSATGALAAVTGAVVIAGSGELAIGVVGLASPVVVFGFSVVVATNGGDVLDDEAVVDVLFALPVVAFGFSVDVATIGFGVLADEAVVDVVSPIGVLDFSLAGATTAGTETGTISTGFTMAAFGTACAFEAEAVVGSPIMRASLGARFEFSSKSLLYVSFDWLVRPNT